jgi:hypothetical protein
MKWYHKLKKYTGEEIGDIFRELAKEHLTLKNLMNFGELNKINFSLT